jgi:hypothetical protein
MKKMNNILSYLDNQIETYRQSKGYYPSKIIMSKETKDKIFAELLLEPTLEDCWFDKKDNYRGIEIEIHNIEEIKLE